jgi:ribosomal protein L3 glutamine methyltransferase
VFKDVESALVTVRDVLRFAVSRFNEAELAFGHGFPSAFEEARYLVFHALHLPHDHADAWLNARLLRKEIADALQLIERRIEERLPAAYLTREAWLGEYRFYVDERVIVPRSLIAESLHEGMEPWIGDRDRVRRALDLCTGSGCLAIVCACEFPRAQVDAVDLSTEALEVAARNVESYNLRARVKLHRSDMFAALKGRKYDLIVSNPPYVSQAVMKTLPREYQQEPRQALAGGKDGLDYVRVILEAAKRHLNPGGLLVVEAGDCRPQLERAFPKTPFTWPQTAGGECVFVLERDAL